MKQLDLQLFFVFFSLVADEPYFSQLGSMKGMIALRVCMGRGDEKLWEVIIEMVMGYHLGAEVPAVLLLWLGVASGIEMTGLFCLCLVSLIPLN